MAISTGLLRWVKRGKGVIGSSNTWIQVRESCSHTSSEYTTLLLQVSYRKKQSRQDQFTGGVEGGISLSSGPPYIYSDPWLETPPVSLITVIGVLSGNTASSILVHPCILDRSMKDLTSLQSTAT